MASTATGGGEPAGGGDAVGEGGGEADGGGGLLGTAKVWPPTCVM